MHALRAALRVFAFLCTRFARRGSAPLPRVRRSCTAVSSEVCGGSAPTPPGLFGGGEGFGSRVGLGWCGGAEPLCALSHYALQERRTRGRGAEPLRAKRVHKKTYLLCADDVILSNNRHPVGGDGETGTIGVGIVA